MTMSTFRGLLYVKHGRIGTRSEGPEYFLQTIAGDYLLRYDNRHPWQPDYMLEFYNRHVVEVGGMVHEDQHSIDVEYIRDLHTDHIPPDATPEPLLDYERSPELVILSADTWDPRLPPEFRLNHVPLTRIYGDGRVVFIHPAEGPGTIFQGLLSDRELTSIFSQIKLEGLWELPELHPPGNGHHEGPMHTVTARLHGRPERRLVCHGEPHPAAFHNIYRRLTHPRLQPEHVLAYPREPISSRDLEAGWYHGLEFQKKLDTPEDWIWIDAGRTSKWMRPVLPARARDDSTRNRRATA